MCHCWVSVENLQVCLGLPGCLGPQPYPHPHYYPYLHVLYSVTCNRTTGSFPTDFSMVPSILTADWCLASLLSLFCSMWVVLAQLLGVLEASVVLVESPSLVLLHLLPPGIYAWWSYDGMYEYVRTYIVTYSLNTWLLGEECCLWGVDEQAWWVQDRVCLLLNLPAGHLPSLLQLEGEFSDCCSCKR
jgi:hypothetical protein